MTNYLRNKSHGGDARQSGGAVILYVLLFLAASALIVGGIIAYQRGVEKQARTSVTGENVIQATDTSDTAFNDDYYRTERGFKSNDPVAEKKEQPDEAEPRTVEPNYRFIGDSRYKLYHRPDCRYVGLLPKERRALLSSEAEAWSRGFIPCKVCKPPLPRVARGDDAPNPSTPKTTTPKTTTPKPPPVDPTVPAKAETPVELKIEDIDVPFKFRVVKSEPDVYQGVVQLDITVDTDRALLRDEVLSLARKLVAAAIKQRKVNAVSIFMRTDPKLRLSIKWVCTAEWAPWGSLSRASEVTAGDYRNHKFRIYQMGFFTP